MNVSARHNAKEISSLTIRACFFLLEYVWSTAVLLLILMNDALDEVCSKGSIELAYESLTRLYNFAIAFPLSASLDLV